MDFFPDLTISLFSLIKCKFKKIYSFILSWVPACVSVHYVHGRSEERGNSPGTGITYSCEL